MPTMRAAVPMLHVPDVEATAAWYEAIGFETIDLVRECDEEGGVATFALLRCGASDVMLSTAGRPSDAFRREVDLYVHVDDVEGMRAAIGNRAELVEELHDTFYGAREFVIRDLNRFWITYGQRLR